MRNDLTETEYLKDIVKGQNLSGGSKSSFGNFTGTSM